MNNFLKNHKGWLAILIVVISLIIDQVIKINVKTSMSLGESIRITDWFYINFIENNGMAWGMTFFNKMVLSLFRLVAISLIGYYLYGQIKRMRVCVMLFVWLLF